jgi:hypothetical protein
MRFESLQDRHERGEMTRAEAAEMLGVAERTFRRGATATRRTGRRGPPTGGWPGLRRGGRRRRSWSGCWGSTKVSRTQLTQVGRALARLGIEHIAAYSPEAAGPLGAAVPDPSGPPAEGAQARSKVA